MEAVFCGVGWLPYLLKRAEHFVPLDIPTLAFKYRGGHMLGDKSQVQLEQVLLK